MTRDADAPPELGIRAVELEIAIRAPLARTWEALVRETAAWWPRTMCTDPQAVGLTIEPKLGGRMYEDWGGGEGLAWATVTALRAPRLLELSGVAAPAWGGPRTHYHSFRLEEQDGGTLLRCTDSVHGRVDAGTERSLREGWQIVLDALRAHCEQRA